MITKKIDSITHISEECLSMTPPCPKSVKIELTPRCNYRCVFCGLSCRKEKITKDMDWNLFTKISRDMQESGVEEIGLFYVGESFIEPSLLVDAIRFLKEFLGIPYVFVTTNGSLAKPNVVENCMEAGLDSLKWSVNFSDAKQFKEMTGVSVSNLESTKKNIALAYQVRSVGNYSTKLYASSIRYSDEQVDKMKPFLNEFVLPYVDEHYWLPFYTMGTMANGGGNSGRFDNPVKSIPCWALFTAGHVLSDGRLTGCCMDATGKWVMGDLKTQTFMEAWNSRDFQKLRRAHLDNSIKGTICEECALG